MTTRRSGFYGHGKKKLLQQVITESEATELLELAGESLQLRNKIKADMKTSVLHTSLQSLHAYMRTHVLLMGRPPRLQDGKQMKKNSTIRHPSDDFTLNHHLERTNDITY